MRDYLLDPVNKLSIPKISDEKICELSKAIQPLFKTGENKELHWMKPVDPRNVAFTWDSESAGAATKVEPYKTIRTLHTYGYYGFFKPSIAEVLAQLPEEEIGTVVGFSTDGPNDVDELNKEKEALNQGFHVGKTTLYRLKPNVP